MTPSNVVQPGQRPARFVINRLPKDDEELW